MLSVSLKQNMQTVTFLHEVPLRTWPRIEKEHWELMLSRAFVESRTHKFVVQRLNMKYVM